MLILVYVNAFRKADWIEWRSFEIRYEHMLHMRHLPGIYLIHLALFLHLIYVDYR